MQIIIDANPVISILIIVSPKVRYTPLGVYLGRGLLPTGSNPTFGDTVSSLTGLQ